MNFVSNLRQKFKNFASDSIFWYGILVLILGVVYVSTLLPGVGYSGDTAKFQFVGRVLGTPHGPGYPTYIVLNHLFTKLFPIGSLAYKANLLSALFSIVSSLLLFHILKLLFNLKNSIAFITSLTFGFTPALWSQSIVAEVYTLHILFVTIVFYFLIKWNKTRQDRNFLIACAFYAFSFGNHLTTIALLPAIIYFVWATDKKVFTDIRKIIWVILFIVVAALQYSYFFWRFYAPHTSYLEMQTPNFERFFWYVAGTHIPRFFSFSITQVFSERIPLFLGLMLKQYLFLIPVAIFGMFRLKNKTVNIFLLLCFLGNMLFTINYNSTEDNMFVFFLPNYLIVAIYLGVGLDSIRTALFRKSLIFYSSLLILTLTILLFANYGKVNQHNNTQVAREIETVLETVKKDSIIISPNYDYSEYFWYYLIGEGLECNNIYIMHHYSIRKIKTYMYENRSFYLREPRKNVPIGLAVYAYRVTPERRAILEHAGFSLLEVRKDLYKVER
ncbi:hypothetical protein ES705_21455 [subsurface metagenome]